MLVSSYEKKGAFSISGRELKRSSNQNCMSNYLASFFSYEITGRYVIAATNWNISLASQAFIKEVRKHMIRE